MTPIPPRVLIATFNPGKARELARLLARTGVAIVTPVDVGVREPYEETGSTYEENARGKAMHYAALAGIAALADDSGLEVDALDGRPGPLSAHYGGAGLDDAGRCRLLLHELGAAPEGGRTARYVAVAALASPAAREGPPPGTRLFRATCEGRIAAIMRGAHGFGYDPIFFYPPFDATFGEIEDGRKDTVSHRGLAQAAVSAFLQTAEGLAFLKE